MTTISVPDLVTSVMSDVERVKELKQELAVLVEGVRTKQADLAGLGVNLDFAALNETITIQGNQADSPETPETPAGRIIAPSVTPVGPPPPSDADLGAEEAEVTDENGEEIMDLSQPLPNSDKRPAADIRGEALAPVAGDAEAFKQIIGGNMSKAIAAGFSGDPKINVEY